jgi:hypothetical protein
VGVRHDGQSEQSLLPGVLHPIDAYPDGHFSPEMVARTEELYARNYNVYNDLSILLRGFRKLGNR